MKNIDRLLIKAKKQCSGDLSLIGGMIYQSDDEPDKWIARGTLWNGVPHDKPGSNCVYATCACDSIDHAISALYELSEKHPNKKDVPIIIDNLLVEECEGVHIDHQGVRMTPVLSNDKKVGDESAKT